MKAVTKILAAGTCIAAFAAATPASAQYYPGYGNPVGAVVDSIIRGTQYGGGYGYGNYGNYGYGNRYGYGYGNQRMAIDQCARAAEYRAGGGNTRYGGYGYGGGYGRGYGARVVGITDVDRRNDGWRVKGLLDAGGNRGRYGAELRFNCRVDNRGRVRDIDLDRRGSSYYRW